MIVVFVLMSEDDGGQKLEKGLKVEKGQGFGSINDNGNGLGSNNGKGLDKKDKFGMGDDK